MKSRYFLALAALVAAQSSSGFTVFLDGERFPGVNNIEIAADDSPPPPVDPGPDPVNPPPNPGSDPNTPPVPDGCSVPAGLTVLEENMPHNWKMFKIKRNEAIALAFDRQHFSNGAGPIAFAENIKGPSPIKQVVISSCPGDFTVTPGCAKEALNERILVDFNGRYKGDDRVCSLEPGQNYYLNARHFDMRSGLTCPKGKTCVLTIRP